MDIKITRTENIKVTPILLAEIFWEMDDQEQREFFDALATVSGEEGVSLDNQMRHVTHNGEISQDALETMKIIGHNSRLQDVSHS